MVSEPGSELDAHNANRVGPPLRVMIATPLGEGGRGGMDRLTDLIIGHIGAAGGLVAVRPVRLTTRGQRSGIVGGGMFAASLCRLTASCLFRRIDVLHLHLAAGGSVLRKYLLARVAALLGVPYVVHIHTGRFRTFWDGASPLVSRCIRDLFSGSARIIVLGRSFESLVVERLPELADRITVMPNATPASRALPRPAEDHVRITFLGVLMDQKGVPQLIEALAGLVSRGNWTAVLAGDGKIDEYKALAARHGIGDRFTFPGWLAPSDVGALLAKTDIFVLPSFSEGLPMSILEAFASGAAVIATPLNAILDVVEHGRNGLLVPAGDVDALRAALERLIGDPELRRSLAEAGRADHRRYYDIEAYVGRLIKIWEGASRRGGTMPEARRRSLSTEN